MQGHLQVASVYAGEDSQELKGPAIVAELKDLLNLLTICIHFSKKPFPLFLEATGYSKEHVLLQEPKAGVRWLNYKFTRKLLTLVCVKCRGVILHYHLERSL